MEIKHNGEILTVHTAKYPNGRVAIHLTDEDGMLYAKLTVNLPNEELKDGEFFVKDYAENEELALSAYESGLFKQTGQFAQSGYCIVPVWRFANDKT